MPSAALGTGRFNTAPAWHGVPIAVRFIKARMPLLGEPTLTDDR
jgi:hypothetical protein